MFKFLQKKTDKELALALLSKSELQKRVGELEAEVKEFQKVLDKINADVPASSFVFDFDTVKVFSIERNYSDNRPVTIIGYLLPEPVTTTGEDGIVVKDVVREWFLYCNQEQHEKIVEKFNNRKGGK